MSVLHQAIPVLDPGDAASNHTLEVQRLLRDLGIASEIYADRTHPSLAGRALPAGAYRDGPVLYQFAIGSALAERLAATSAPLAIDYHNLTPADFFERWDAGLVHATSWGRAQLAGLARRCSLGMAVSAFNESELIALGYPSTAVAPLLVDLAAFDRAIDVRTRDRLHALKASGGPDWLFVGRIVPNKAQHDVVKAFALYRRHVEPSARLWLVGGASIRSYEATLRATIDALGLGSAVTLTGAVTPGVLAAHYATADVFVCLSRHEGFCVPVLEALHHDVPVVAAAEGAVPETLGRAGLLLPDRAPETVAVAVDRVLTDTSVRNTLIAAGRRRVAELSLERTRVATAEILTAWLSRVSS